METGEALHFLLHPAFTYLTNNIIYLCIQLYFLSRLITFVYILSVLGLHN